MFIYSLPLFFAQIGVASPFELLVVAIGLFVVFFISAPYVDQTESPTFRGHYLFAAWTGNVTLQWVFWPFFLIFNISLFLADTFATRGLLTVSSWDEVHLMLLLPTVWWTTAIWRCSYNSQLRALTGGARFLTLVVFFEYSLKLLIRIDYPRLFFGCEELLLDYGSCF